MNLRTISLQDFLANGGILDGGPAMAYQQNMFFAPGQAHQLKLLKTVNAYSIVSLHSISEMGDVAAIDSNGNDVGFYSGNSLILDAAHQRQGIGTGMILWAYHFRLSLPTQRSLSQAGQAAFTAAWEVANGKRYSPWWP